MFVLEGKRRRLEVPVFFMTIPIFYYSSVHIAKEHCPRMYNHKSAYVGIVERALSFLWKHLILYDRRQP